MRDIYELLESLIEGRNNFLNSNTIRALPYNGRQAAVSQYLQNDMFLSSLITRLYLEQIQNRRYSNTILQFNIPENFMEAVSVVPTSLQISNSLEDSSSSGNCAICQDQISSGGSRIRQCGHSFHRSCILTWFLMNVHCPICRHDIREENLVDQTSTVSSETTSQ